MLTVVTAIFGKGFALHEPTVDIPHRLVCFTDQPIESKRWEIIRKTSKLSPRRANRHFKILLHRYVDGPTLYLDSEYLIQADPSALLGDALERGCWAATRHPRRDCLFDEARFCAARKHVESPEALTEQADRYRASGMPRHFGLWACCFFARRGDSDSERFSEAWWSEVREGSERDQVSAPFVAWRLGLKPADLPGVYTALPGFPRRKVTRPYGDRVRQVPKAR